MNLARALQFGFGCRLPVIRQAEAAECGIACLAMVLGYYGHQIDLGTFRRCYSISLKGTTLRGLIAIADEMGLATRALRLELSDLPRLHLPCILHWSMNHFVVLEQVRHNSIIIHDPARGRRTVPLREVSNEFTGVALELSPTGLFVKKDERNNLRFRDLFRNLTGLGPPLSRIFLLSIGLEMVVLLIPIASQIVIDEVIVNSDWDLLLVVVVGLALLLLIQLFLGIARTWAIMMAGTTLNLHWNTGLIDHLIRLPLDFFEKRHIGDIVSRFGSLSVIGKSVTTDLVRALLDGIMSIGTLAMLFVYGGWLGYVALITAALDVTMRIVAYRPYYENTEASIAYEAKQQTHFIETIRGMASVKLLGLGNRRRATWLNHLVDTLNARLRLQRLDLVFSQANDLLFGVDRLILLMLGAYMVINGRMTLGMLVAFLAYKDQFASRVGSLLTTGFQIRMLNLQTDRLADIVMAEPEPRDTGRPVISCPQFSGATELRAEGLSHRYGDNEPWIFQDISIQIPAGRCVAITGPSGCGKTSLLKVLMGLLSPTEGSIYLDGVDLNSIGATSYRDRIAGVMQDDGLFAGSIAENICSFDENPDTSLIGECAARAAILDDILRMPMGFETLVGDMGSTLSGGQKQRVVLARALYRRPAILFLDEATNHLDEPTEANIVAGLRDLSMTRVIVAHRSATVALADEIVSLPVLTRPRPRPRGKVAPGADFSVENIQTDSCKQ
jgi:ATP-binding cassette, subfamily B, bacterial CvaB/MchF/RaxB